MLTQSRLQRSVGRSLMRRPPSPSSPAWAVLLEELARNGLPTRGPLRDHLAAESDSGAAGSIALALRRACEINYQITDEIRALAVGLLDRQEPDGGFAGAVSTACALGALHAASLLAQCSDGALAGLLAGAAARAAGALERATHEPVSAAIALAQCADSGLVREAALWEIVNSERARRDPSVRATLQQAGLLHARRAA